MSTILKKPLITEKLTRIQETFNQYCFEVDIRASKPEIKAEIERLYPEVTVTKVRTLITSTKPKGRFTKGGYISGRTAKVKKAFISLKDGQEIDFFSEI
ncbi:MAG: 50S ribosomal protein L23 [Balneolales bacterium]|nr:50S ribosomal protein L23 [Balneolales bacterium]